VAIAPVLVPASGRTSANDSAWRWKIVAGISVLGMASVLGWHLVGARSALGGPQLARMQAVPAAGGMVMIRDPQLDALIAAHQQQGGNSALQTPAGFVRNAAFERPAP
jgi:sigma-E factor negative regulatory protein RseA